METDYVERRLTSGDEILTEAACLAGGGIVVVLAEPGAGKTALLKSFANRLNAPRYSASVFRHTTITGPMDAVVVDSLDEVARRDRSALDQVIVKAQETRAATVIFASRSSEWADARSRFVEDCFSRKPKIVRLHPFSGEEQQAIFENNFPGEDFSAFLAEAVRFELAPLLGNPMFLRLLAEAYLQGGHRFQSKGQIFKDAIDRLASGDPNNDGTDKRPPADVLVAAASEVFAKLMLSGAVGVSVTERLGDRDFPYLYSLSTRDHSLLANALDTRLFRQADNANLHEPVHRIVAEYCAARYLAQRIDDPSDRLSVRRCFAVLAPNGVVRDELRGMLGWLAALGNKVLQEMAIALDPYSVLANGDPSQLTGSSKLLLLRSLRELSKVDPYFRRSDMWRRFNAAGFFTVEIVDELKEILTSAGDSSQLLDLVLELVQASEAATLLTRELRALVLDPQNEIVRRIFASRCLLANPSYDSEDDLRALLDKGDLGSLRLVAEAAMEHQSDAFDRERLLELFRRLAEPTNPPKGSLRRSDDSRHFIGQLVDSLSSSDTVWLLGELTNDLRCTCGAEKDRECRCRSTISGIVGRLLDRYFDISHGEHDPAQVWQWVRNLKFERSVSTSESVAVRTLQSNSELRQSIYLLAFDRLTAPDEIWETICYFRSSSTHVGLAFQAEDARIIADHAFMIGNVALWISFAHRHNRYAEVKASDELRAHMRAQARKHPEFMREWTKKNRAWRDLDREDRYWPRRDRRYQRRIDASKEARLAHLRANRAQIERGEHFGWTQQLAEHYLYSPEEMSQVVDDVRIVEQALANCIPSLLPHVPTLGELAAREKQHIAMTLHAACLMHFRKTGSLSAIDRNVLAAVRTDVARSNGYGEGEFEKFEAELDAELFTTIDDVEAFVREFIEPTIQSSSSSYWISWLEHKKAFRPLQNKMAAEWLGRFPNASEETTGMLFDMLARSGDRSWLIAFIEARCRELAGASTSDASESEAACRKFWHFRHFFFCDNEDGAIWTELLSDRDTIFALEHRAGRFNRDEAIGWPPLSAEKAYRILDAYVEVWPKVFLPSSWGTDSPKEETAYRFLTDVIWRIERDDPDRSIAVLDRILADGRFADFQTDVRSMKASAIRRRGLRDFVVPKPAEVTALLDAGAIASVEDMRALLIEELEALQVWLKGADTDPLETFYPSGKRVDENTARSRIVERLQGRMEAKGMSVVIEHHMANSNRCDFTTSASTDGRRLLLVTEVKGQWHRELFSAAATQLNERYAVHPDAAQQGVYLALWFGGDEEVAGRRNDDISTAGELRTAIVDAMPPELRGLIDVFVLDLSCHPKKLK